MKYNKKISVSLIVALVVVSSLFVISAGLDKSNKNNIDMKTYGQCVNNQTVIKNDCLKSVKQNFFSCLSDAWSNTNRTLIKSSVKACVKDKENKTDSCQDDFKLSKETCLVYKCDYNSTTKIYLIKSPSECKNTAVNCEFGYEKFKDDCGCGCKAKPEKPTKTCNQLNEAIEKELKNVQKCTTDSECVTEGLHVPCNMEMCKSVYYSNNSNLSLLNDLTRLYEGNCKLVCPMLSCPVLNSQGSCDHGYCKAKKLEENKTKTDDSKHYCKNDNRNKVCPAIYMPVCGWNDPQKIQCIKYPCASEYSNSCVACSTDNILFYTDGACPK